MIGRREIDERVREWGLREDIVEKDYVLGWLLAAIGRHPALQGTWVFKGGTCLKKCYFETYRFSEDLDFTVTAGGPQDANLLLPVFHEIAATIYEESGIEIPAGDIRFDAYTNPRGKQSLQGRIPYSGPRRQQGSLPRVKIDVTSDELLVRPPVRRPIAHPYPESLPGDGDVLAYDYVEIFAEKLRALAERLRPRDLYDVVNLYRHSGDRPQAEEVMAVLGAKCQFKGIAIPSLASLENAEGRTELAADWENMLRRQLPELPPLNHFWAALPEVFNWLEGRLKPVVLPAVPMARDEQPAWAPPPTVTTWGASVPLETIRFAGVNRLCVELRYRDAQGVVATRVIEPYSLRRTQENNLVLHALRADNREHRSYRVDRILRVQVTDRPFTPVYEIEFSAIGSIRAPSTTAAHRVTGTGRRRSSFVRRSGPRYVLECTVCGKRFYRKTRNQQLRPHKDKHGSSCLARRAILVDRIYD